MVARILGAGFVDAFKHSGVWCEVFSAELAHGFGEAVVSCLSCSYSFVVEHVAASWAVVDVAVADDDWSSELNSWVAA